MLNGLGLFSGIEGITLALSPWVSPVAYCERDRYDQAVLMSRMWDGRLPWAPIWDDITTLVPGVLPGDGSIDVIYGGFPCQDISVAGTGEGLEGERSGLFFEITRLAGRLRPAFIFLENVPAISLRGLDQILMVLDALGYDCRWTIVSAEEVGAPHLRERWFLLAYPNGGGRKGKQAAVLKAGTYRINPEMFTVEQSPVVQIPAGCVGIVTTLDGVPLPEGEIAGCVFEGHENFQRPEAFLKAGGFRGLQEQLLLPGEWNINPWFAKVDLDKMTEIEIGHVGVVTSYIGEKHTPAEGDADDKFKHGKLVPVGFKGVWDTPLQAGLHPVNHKTMRIEIVPTTNVVLNWSEAESSAHELDENLCSIAVRSKDGFTYKLDVSVIIHIPEDRASRVVSRMGGVQKLIANMMEPLIANYFRNAAQDYSALEFLSKRKEIQSAAAKSVKTALTDYDVEAVDTVIGDASIPAELLKTQTDRKLAEEMQETFKVQQESQKQAEALARQEAIVANQAAVVKAEQDVLIAGKVAEQAVKEAEGKTKVKDQEALQVVKIAKAESEANVEKAKGEAAIILEKGKAQAESFRLGVEAMGKDQYTLVQVMSVIGKEKVKVIPDVIIGGGGGKNGGENPGMMLANLIMSQLVTEKAKAAGALPVAAGARDPGV